MKNLLVILFFSILSLFSLVVMVFLIFLPKLCVCLNTFCNKNYPTIKKQNTRARRIKRARLRLLFKNQVSHEQPTQKELDRSEGIFFDEESQCRLKDEDSLLYFNKGKFEKVSATQILLKGLLSWKNKFQSIIVSAQAMFRKTILARLQHRVSVISGYLSASVDKYLNH